MKVLSLFDGISCARVALERVGLKIDSYDAWEIDKYAIQISKKNYPDIRHHGDIKLFFPDGITWDIDLLVGGSPCQDLSIAKRNRKGLDGERSGLFWEYVRILNEIKPKYFILENVNSMSSESKDLITKTLGVQPIMINASLVSAQQRKRLFWTNIPNVTQPLDKNIFLKDIIESGYSERDKSLALTATYSHGCAKDYFIKSSRQMIFNAPVRIGQIGNGGQGDRIYSTEGKSVALSANGGGRGAKTGLYIIQTPRGNNRGGIRALDGKTPTLTSSFWEFNNKLFEDGVIRKLSPIECERLQGLPEIEQSCIIRVCSGNQNNLVNAENQNHKSLKSVGSVEKEDSKEVVKNAERNLNIKHQQTNSAVLPDVVIGCEENGVEIHSHGKLLAHVSGVELKQNAPYLKSIDDFVRLIVGLNTIVEKIITIGKGELRQKNNLLVVTENGNNVVNIYGEEIMQLANDVKNDSITLNKLLKSITLDLSIQENKEQIIQILFSYVVNAILGYIPKEILNQSILTFQIKNKVGYSYGVSNSQRYKMLGNAFNVDVMAHILSFIPR